MFCVIVIMLRAVFLEFLASESNAFRSWQNSHCTPSEELKNVMAPSITVEGSPFMAMMFLKASSAFLSGEALSKAWPKAAVASKVRTARNRIISGHFSAVCRKESNKNCYLSPCGGVLASTGGNGG